MENKETGEVITTLSGDVGDDTTVAPKPKYIVHIYDGENEIKTMVVYDFEKGVETAEDAIRKLGLGNWFRIKREE